MSPYYKRLPAWPLALIVACLLLLTVLAPWRWRGTMRWQRPPERVAQRPTEDRSPESAAPPTLQAQPVTVSKQQPIAPAGQMSSADEIASEFAGLTELVGPSSVATVAPPVAERIDLDPSIVETPALPVVQKPVSPSKAPSDSVPPSESTAPTGRPEPMLRDRAEVPPPATTWPYPSVLAESLHLLSNNDVSRAWSEPVLALLDRLVKVDSLGDAEAAAILEQLKQLEREPQQIAPRLESAKSCSLMLRAGYALQRHLAIWQAVHSLATQRAPLVARGSDPRRLLAILDEVNDRLQDISHDGAWREYLLLGPLNELARDPRGMDADELRAVARRVLQRVEGPALSLKQSDFFQQRPFPQLTAELKCWASEPVDYQKLLRDIEQYERSGQSEDAQRVVRYYQVLRWSPDNQVARLAEVLNMHYRNANARVAVSIDLINRLMPPPQQTSEEVVDNIAQADVYGQAKSTTRLRVTLLPDRWQWRLGLEADADVSSDTESRKGPAAFFHDAWAKVKARKVLTVDSRGVRVGRSEAAANIERNLKGFATDYDDVPFLGMIARSIAKQKHDEKYQQSQVEAENKLAWRASSRLDTEVQDRLKVAEKQFQERLLKPLQELDLKPTAVDMETTEKRLVVRERLAGNQQLGAHTPRPQAPGDSWLSIQLHETALNNALEHMGLDGRETDLDTLFREVTRRFIGRDVPLPEDLPEDVKVHFADSDAVRIKFDGGRIRLTIRVAELSSGKRKHWRNFIVQAFYKPTSNQRDANLERDGVIQLAGERLDFGDQVALRGIFSKILSRNRNLNLINKNLAENPKLADLHVSQFVVEDGWIGIAMNNSGVSITISDDPQHESADRRRRESLK